MEKTCLQIQKLFPQINKITILNFFIKILTKDCRSGNEPADTASGQRRSIKVQL